jgi:hypothetical protein
MKVFFSILVVGAALAVAAPSPKAVCMHARGLGPWHPDCGYPNPGYGGPPGYRGPDNGHPWRGSPYGQADDAWGWGSNDPHSLYRALNRVERAHLEKLASDYDDFEDAMEEKYELHFCDAGDDDCDKQCSYGPGQKFEDVFNGGCLEGADHGKLRMLKQALSRYLSEPLAKYRCTKEHNGRIYW